MNLPPRTNKILMQAASAVAKWLRTHKLLVTRGLEFSQSVLQTISGELSESDLQVRKDALESLRIECSAAYAEAFPPGQAGAPRGT